MTDTPLTRDALNEANDRATAPERLMVLASLPYEGEAANDEVRLRRQIRRAAALNPSLPLGCLRNLLSEGSSYAWGNPHVEGLMRDMPTAPWREYAVQGVRWAIAVTRMQTPPLSTQSLDELVFWAATHTMGGYSEREAAWLCSRIAPLFKLQWPKVLAPR